MGGAEAQACKCHFISLESINMQTCTVKLSFNSAKRLPDFAGKCQFVHGYGHMVEATFAPTAGLKGDMVVDFYQLKAGLASWLDKHWDHTILLHEKDRQLGGAISSITGQEPFYFNASPTSEVLAEYLLHEVCPGLASGVVCNNVRVYDTPDSWVDACLD
jgi:6-pyruvoyltetrahydropterin/6-carboxytetrahydropterin synthase